MVCLSTAVLAQNTFTEKEIEEFVENNPEYCDCDTKKKSVVAASLLPENGKVTFMLSGGINYMYGTENTDNTSFQEDYSSWFGEVMLGYRYYGRRESGGSTLAIFGTAGNTSGKALQRMVSSSSIDAELEAERDNYFLNLEAGVVLLQALRVSTGIGTQRYYLTEGSRERLSYFSTTAGLRIGPENFKIMPALNLMYGRDLSTTIYRPQLQIGIQF